MSYLVVGLGNPGKEYQHTRHNIGRDFFPHLNFYDQLTWIEKFKGLYTSIDIKDRRVYFLIPGTYMNLSGQSVAQLVQFYKIAIDDVLVCHDELDLPFGTIALKKAGGLAGHNGLKSIAAELGGQDFCRLRMGIGRPPLGSVSNWVLSRMSGDELIQREEYLKSTAKILEFCLEKGFEKAQGLYSKKKIIND